VDDDRLAGTMMCSGSLLGLTGTISTVFPFSFLGLISFGLVSPSVGSYIGSDPRRVSSPRRLSGSRRSEAWLPS